MFYKLYIFMAAVAFILTACNGDEKGSKDNAENNKTPEEKCVKGISDYFECLSSLGEIDMTESSSELQKCKKQVRQDIKKQSLSGEKMSQVMNSLQDKIFASFSLSTEGEDTSITIDPEMPENCKQKEEETEKQKCILQEHIKTACKSMS